MPDTLTGDSLDCDIEEFFGEFRQWVQLLSEWFLDNVIRVDGFKYILFGMALQRFNDIPAADIPADLNALQADFYERFRVIKD